jgi:hypothetical protein
MTAGRRSRAGESVDFPRLGILTRQDGTSMCPNFGTVKLTSGVAKPFALDREDSV